MFYYHVSNILTYIKEHANYANDFLFVEVVEYFTHQFNYVKSVITKWSKSEFVI
jgi:hypothetical protein